MTAGPRAQELADYARAGHRTVKGWLSPIAIHVVVALAKAQRELGVSGPACEIGVHHGRLFILLHLLTDAPELSVAYDLFERQHENVGSSGRGDRERLVQNLGRHRCDLSRIRMVTENSLNLTPADVIAATGGPVRLFSVDGGHTADTTQHDLSLAAQTIGDGGLVILDDMFNPSWPGVAEAAYRTLSAAGATLVPVAIAGNKLVLTTSADRAAAYIAALGRGSQDCLLKSSRMCGHDVLILTRHDPSLLGRTLNSRAWRWLRGRPLGQHLRRRFGNGASG